MDRGAWQTTVHRTAKSRTRLNIGWTDGLYWLVQTSAGWRPRKSWCFSLSLKAGKINGPVQWTDGYIARWMSKYIILPPLKTSSGEVSLRGLGSQTCHLSMMFLLGEVPWGNGLGHSLSQGLRVSNSDHCLIISRLTAAWRQRGQTNS